VNVTVRLYASLRELVAARDGELVVDVPEGTTVSGLTVHLGLPAGVVRLAFVGGVARDESHVLLPGDEVGMFPPVAGGA
jgi:molybdopterin converting factor small subunit